MSIKFNPLSGNFDMDSPSDVNRAYVDAADALKVNKAGDTMGGDLTTRGIYAYTSGMLIGTNANPYQSIRVNEVSLGGTGKPLILTGTGFPNGVISAPVGSTYIDTNATNGAIEWKKATGTGNTGWVVSVGDTGWRDVSSSVNGFSSGILRIKRKDNTVIVSVVDLNLGVSSGSQFDYYTLPSGFGASQWQFSPVDQNLIYKRSLANGGVLRIYSLTASTNINGGFSFDTNAAWPTTLPGIAV